MENVLKIGHKVASHLLWGSYISPSLQMGLSVLYLERIFKLHDVGNSEAKTLSQKEIKEVRYLAFNLKLINLGILILTDTPKSLPGAVKTACVAQTIFSQTLTRAVNSIYFWVISAFVVMEALTHYYLPTSIEKEGREGFKKSPILAAQFVISLISFIKPVLLGVEKAGGVVMTFKLLFNLGMFMYVYEVYKSGQENRQPFEVLDWNKSLTSLFLVNIALSCCFTFQNLLTIKSFEPSDISFQASSACFALFSSVVSAAWLYDALS